MTLVLQTFFLKKIKLKSYLADVEILIMIFDNHFSESSLEEYFAHSRVSLIVRDKTP